MINSEKVVFIAMAERLKGNKRYTSLDYANGYNDGVDNTIAMIIEYYEDLEEGKNDN